MASIENQELPAFNTSEFRICFLGRVDQKQKRVFDLLNTMVLLKNFGLPVHLTIIGDGPSRVELEHAFIRERLTDRVTFTGWISHDEALAALGSQNAFLLPSAYEGFSGALCEAMAAGVVPIATQISGSEDAISDGYNGFLVQVGNFELIADRVCEMAKDETLYRTLSENARSTARKKYSVASSMQRLLFEVSQLPERSSGIANPLATNLRWLSLESPLVPNIVTSRLRRIKRAAKRRIPTRLLHRYRLARYPHLRETEELSFSSSTYSGTRLPSAPLGPSSDP